MRKELSAYPHQNHTMPLLRFITCGSVDDGKSTLIGRLLFEACMLYEDQLLTLQHESQKYGTTGDELDFALLVDGLVAEREQGITIDVAYRYFTTEKRKFIVADTPGHEQYTRNMATGASTADLAVIMIDARKGILEQTRRHSFIVSILGIKHVVLAINKMDLVNYDHSDFVRIQSDYLTFAEDLGFTQIQAIPISALKGDNVINTSLQTPWYDGPTLLYFLEHITINPNQDAMPLRMPVQWVNRPHQDFRGYAGRICAGQMKAGDDICILPGHQRTTIERIITFDGDIDHATTGQSITCILKDAIDVSRGSVLVSAKDPCEIASQFEARIFWMAEKPLIPSRQYRFKSYTVNALCTPGRLKYRIHINTMEKIVAKELKLNEIGDCDISLDRTIAFEPYVKNRELGSFILIDRVTNETVAAGILSFALRRSSSIQPQPTFVEPLQRSIIKLQKPAVLWFTGLSGSGKSTISNLVESKLNAIGKHTMLLDGDNIRHGLNRDLDFTEAGRAENIRRIAEVAKLMTEAGLITLVAFISPFQSEREMARELLGDMQFLEIYVHASLEVLEARDVKGLYKKARNGEIPNFTGICSPYEPPISPTLIFNTEKITAEDASTDIISLLYRLGIIDPDNLF